MPSIKHVLPWVDRLTGLEPDRVERAVAIVASWDLPDLTARLGKLRTIDDAVRTFFLADAVETLTARGVPKNKLLAKLKDTAQFESTWAELRCAAVVAQTSDADIGIELDARTAEGKRPDLRLILPEGPPHTSVEIKSVGMADIEFEFMRRMDPALDVVIPPYGMVTIHAPLEGKAPRWTPELAAWASLDAPRRATAIPGYPKGMAAAAIVAHGGEELYVRRATSSVTKAIRQLRPGDECWVALHWGNGAPIAQVATALDWSVLPAHVGGVLFVGSVVAFPHRNIDVFVIRVPRGYRAGDPSTMRSSMDRELAELILERTDASSGVRATLIRGSIQGKPRQVLRRNGTDRIPPFNLVLDRDATGFRESGVSPTDLDDASS